MGVDRSRLSGPLLHRGGLVLVVWFSLVVGSPVSSAEARVSGSYGSAQLPAARGSGVTSQEPIDCLGPVQVTEPGTQGWDELNDANAYCARERDLDKPPHRVLENTAPADAYREPARHDDVRFRYDTTTIGGLEAEVYRPCAAGTCRDQPDSLETFEPPYPAVITFHGGASNKQLHWWSSQPMAEAGYLVVAFDSPAGPTPEDATTMVDWLHGDDPLAADFDGERLGIAGHSRGGVVVSEFGQRDPRVSAIVSWDRAQSTPLPADLPLETPTLFMFADYNCQDVPICNPERYETKPDPDGPGNKGEDFLLLQEAGVDSMQIPLRAALHLDWIPSQPSGNRYAEVVTVYYTLAWFDRYVRGMTEPDVAEDAFDRLTASEFDDSADRHNISQGIFDPDLAAGSTDPYAGNVPYRIAGLPVADRLSFYYLSKCFLTPPGSSERLISDDVRADGCVAPTPAGSASDAESSSGATGRVVLGAVVLGALLLGGALLVYRRSARHRA
jgi:dienelactone hydrolase